MLPVMDVRDVARAHVLMLTDKRFNKNGRFLLSTQSLWFSEIIELLKKNRRETGSKRIKTRVLGQIPLNIAAIFINPEVRQILPFVNKKIYIETDPRLD
jgi:nucleoside-diphosphate-sugar epimerase